MKWNKFFSFPETFKSSHIQSTSAVSPRSSSARQQGCQMVCFQTHNPKLGKFWRTLDWQKVIYFTAIWNIYGHSGYFITLWHILCSSGTFLFRCGIMDQEKSGDPARQSWTIFYA
jgi:hypothetical protein